MYLVIVDNQEVITKQDVLKMFGKDEENIKLFYYTKDIENIATVKQFVKTIKNKNNVYKNGDKELVLKVERNVSIEV